MTKPTSDFFVPEDFRGYPINCDMRIVISWIVGRANVKLAKHLEGLPVVYGASIIAKRTSWDVERQPEDLFAARLWNPTPIQPERAAETAEDLLREMIERMLEDNSKPLYGDLYDRAKAMLAKAGE